jgi:hypothetical protein
MIISRSVLPRMKNFSDKTVEKIKARILCSVSLSPENRDVYEIMWKNTVQPERSQMAIQYDTCPLHAG